MTRQARMFAMIAALTALVLVAGLSMPLQAQSAATGEPVKIGIAVSLTGAYARTGEYMLEGVKLWREEVNARGGLLGRPVAELIIYDDKSDPSTSARLYERLITQDRVDLVMAPYSSAVTFAVGPVTEKYRYPIVATGAASTKIWEQGYKYIFMNVTAAELYQQGAAELAAEVGAKTAVIIGEDTLFPKSSGKGAVELGKKHGIEISLQEDYPKGATDFSALLTKIKALNPDVVFANTYFPDAVALIRQMKELDVNPKVFGFTVGPALPEFGKELGALAEYVLGAAQWDASLNYPGNKEFVENYTKMFGRLPDYHSASGYSGGVILEAAINKAGLLERDEIRDALATLELATPFGEYKVDDRGFQLAHKMVTLQWQDGQLQVVWPKELATAKFRAPAPLWKDRPKELGAVR